MPYAELNTAVLKMSLEKLPEELLIIIFRQLDLNSIRNLYDAGNKRLQEVISSQGAVREAKLSFSTLATAKSLKLNFVKAISRNLQDLNLSAVHDLTKSKLLLAVKNMTSLVTLNVGYTNITILDLLEVYERCPTIKNITINYKFHRTAAKVKHFSMELVEKCQDMFANFENVHFVGSMDNLLCSNLPLHIVQKAKLNALTYTIAEDTIFTCYKYVEMKPLVCNVFSLKMCYWKPFQYTYQALPDTIKELPFEYEFIHIRDCSINISPAFSEYFKENYRYNRVSVTSHIGEIFASNSNHKILIWNKETTKFDGSFFRDLDSKIKKLQPCVVTFSEGMQPVVLSNDWVCIKHPLMPDNYQRKTNTNGSKKKRVAASNITIDYDEMLQDKKNIELTICFNDRLQCPVTLSRTSSYLKKLSFLQLRGKVRYSKEFFNILFRCCENLTTLDIEGNPISPCAPPISRSIPLSRSIKNLRIVDKTIDMNNLFSSLGQSTNLENIVIRDSSQVSSAVPNAETLFKKCENLYYLGICVNISESTVTKKLAMLNKLKDKYKRHHLVIDIFSNLCSEYSYDTFIDVFRLVVKDYYLV